jgi:DNA-binding LacI/PurR family transcriptional regulator
MKELLHERTIPDAVFGAYDNMAIGALKAIYEAGLRIPEDICVVGYDNIRQSEYLYRPLTTIYTPLARLVEKGNKLLMERMKKGNTTPLVHENLATELILRETTR